MAGKLATQLMYRLKSSHSPFLSIPDRLAEVIQELASTAVSKNVMASDAVEQLKSNTLEGVA